MTLFTNASTNAIAATAQYQPTATGRVNLLLEHPMTAGTTSTITVDVYLGPSTTGTMQFNINGLLGAITKSGISIMEICV